LIHAPPRNPLYYIFTPQSGAVSGSDDADYIGELQPYISGDKTPPIPTYFIGAYGLGSKAALAALANSPNCGIRHLGRVGVTSLSGLQVAYLEGRYNAAAYRAEEEEHPDAAGWCRYYTKADTAALKKLAAEAEGDIDILLTNDWPARLCDGLPEGSLPSYSSAGPPPSAPAGSEPCADVALFARPRYHFAAEQSVFYARQPYLNANLGAGSHVTRFIALGAVGNTLKQKWLHALGLVPAAEMDQETLTAVPAGTTSCPYEGRGVTAGIKRGAAEGGVAGIGNEGAGNGDGELGSQSWRWADRSSKRQRGSIAAPSLGRADVERDRAKTVFVRNVPFRASEDELVTFFSRAGPVVDLVRRTNTEGKLNSFCHVQFATREGMERACQLNESELLGRRLYIEPAKEEKPKTSRAAVNAAPVEGCWFCLSNPNADIHLVASVGEECYMALDKGPISDRHVLVLPVEHYASSLQAPLSVWEEMERYLSALRSCFAAEGKALVGFERFMRLRKSGGNHCHVNGIAIPAAAADGARAVFEDAAARHGFGLSYLAPASGDAAREQLAAAVGDGEYFVALLPDGSRLVHPIAYGERHPLDYGREVLARMVGAPERADWKACKCASEADESSLTEQFKAVFKPYDVMQGDS
jgi:diadenosine tetraphosphate (Ap4A) HIT family hydrolase